jgi:UDP-2,3-diacylglucosamine pyrophosphatase LpxH
MRILAISDVHLGSKSRIAGSDGELCVLLKSEPWDQVVVVGDLFDFWEATFEEIVQAHPTVLATLESLETVIVIGNHDAQFAGIDCLNGMKVVTGAYTLEDAGTTIVFQHGHEFDKLSLSLTARFFYWLTEKLDAVAQWFAGSGVSLRREIRYSLVESGTAESFSDNVSAGSVLSAPEADVVVSGHTHIPLVKQIGTTVYVNCGDFGPEHQTYVVIEDGVPKPSWKQLQMPSS